MFVKNKNNMRTIAELPHPDFKITLFGMNNKFIIKFEQGTLEKVYKIAETDITDGATGVFQLIDDAFTDHVKKQFQLMRTAFIEAYNRHKL